MLSRKLSVLQDLADALPKEELEKRAALPFLRELKESVQGTVQETLQDAVQKTVDAVQETVQDTVQETVQKAVEVVQNTVRGERIAMPFLHDMTPDIISEWNWQDFDPAGPNDKPNMNLAVMGLILATNIESTVGKHAWSLVEYSLDRLGFTNIVHQYFESAEKVNHPAMAFGRSVETVNGKTVVAAVYRGSSSIVDFISDAKAEPGGFHQAGINATNELRAYCSSQKLTKENTILFITGHSYGASSASLVGIMSTDLAERDSIFCYSYATPNYIRNGLTGEGMKMFSFNSNEDVVPQVPVGPNLDKTGGVIQYDRLDMKLNHPEQYARFLKLYEHYRDCDYESDTDFLPNAYTFKPYVKRPVDNVIIRNHMPYTYMPFLLSVLPDEVVDSYIVEVPKPAAKEQGADWEMFVGEVYKLPLTGTGLFTWESSDTSVASINEKGMITGVSAGDALLTVTSPGGKQTTLKICVLEA